MRLQGDKMQINPGGLKLNSVAFPRNVNYTERLRVKRNTDKLENIIDTYP